MMRKLLTSGEVKRDKQK